MNTSKLLDVSLAREKLLTHFEAIDTEKLPVDRCLGRILAETVVSNFDLPLFSNSSMDGFGICVTDFEKFKKDHSIILDVVGDIPAGKRYNRTLKPGQAVRIMTGAPVPDGVDAVVPVEYTNIDFKNQSETVPEKIEIKKEVRQFDNIRIKGSDLRKGDTVLEPGRKIRPQDIGFLTMLGIVEVKVHKIPRVAVFSTGDELIKPGQELLHGKIFDSNSPSLKSLLQLSNVDVINFGIIPDTEQDIAVVLNEILKNGVDLILSSAGVSVGVYDFVRKVIEDNGQLEMWRINMRPGKPFMFGYYKDTPIIGLPGNPVSAYVSFLVFVQPVINKIGGYTTYSRPTSDAKLLTQIHSDGRESYLRAKISKENGELVADLTGHQGSGNMHSLVKANALIKVPAGIYNLPANSIVRAWIIGEYPN